jgi:Ca2+-binding RTX toxin-like protein
MTRPYPGAGMGVRGQGMLVALGVIGAIALIVGGAMVLAGGGNGSNGPDRLIGTNHADTLNGRGGADVIKGLRGRDTLTGGPGFDRIDGGRGNDRINARDHHLDAIDCGRGKDVAIVDRAEDGVYDCERVVVPKSFQKVAAR